MSPTRSDEFYIGYDGPMPPGAARQVRRFVATAVAGGLGVAAIVLAAQRPFPPARFDFGRPAPAEGVLVRDPYPALVDGNARTWLVAPGKRGADALVGQDGRRVRLQGAAIVRGASRMLEVVPGTVTVAGGATIARPDTTPLGHVTLHGEIVDSKCFLGVMNPGERTVHRDCAARCLLGGIPPLFVARDDEGREHHVMLVGPGGEAVGERLAPLAGRPVTLAGELERRGGALFMRIGELP